MVDMCKKVYQEYQRPHDPLHAMCGEGITVILVQIVQRTFVWT